MEKHDEENIARWRQIIASGATLRMDDNTLIHTPKQLDAYLAGEPLPDTTATAQEEPLQPEPAADPFEGMTRFLEHGEPTSEHHDDARLVYVGAWRPWSDSDHEENQIFLFTPELWDERIAPVVKENADLQKEVGELTDKLDSAKKAASEYAAQVKKLTEEVSALKKAAKDAEASAKAAPAPDAGS